jgi:hypothetical protein
MLPNLFIIGAMKSASTSLHYYLKAHPEIFMSEPKEIDYFIEERNWEKGQEWYEDHFPEEKAIRGESSVNYSRCHLFEGVPQRIHAMSPDAKLIYVLRDPIERAVSHYRQRTIQGVEERPIGEALSDLTDNDYIKVGMYHMQLTAFMEYFDQSKLLIVTMEELNKQQQETLQKVFRFLGVDENFHSKEYGEVLNRSVDKRPRNALGKFLDKIPLKQQIRPLMPAGVVRAYSSMTAAKPAADKSSKITPELRQSMAEILKEDVARLREFSGLEFEDWSL